ncbi:LTA synthase family protein [Lachnobacterium bovis]|uniref:LTA synthase family protein n=1 Tax=Lachnobacterium bovis TaxID=140626 RepID=UPI0003B7AA4A|nr:alkaline phosphatase family protein [Lachnobacterium bovis]
MSIKFRKFNFPKLNFPRKKDDAHTENSNVKTISPERQKRIDFLNKYSLLFHVLLSCGLVFVIEWISRRSLISACGFVGGHTLAYFYNAFLVFASLTLVYLFRRRAFFRLIISSVWFLLGVTNGVILSNRVTPFAFTDFKMVSDLLAMTNTHYFTITQAILVVVGLGLFILFLALFFIMGPKYQGKIHYIIAPICVLLILFAGVPTITTAAQKSHVVASYFANIAQGYENYGFVYSFSSSVIDRGMKKPHNYNQETIDSIEAKVNSQKQTTTLADNEKPNVICILLESFCDPEEIKFLHTNKDPIPTFHKLEKEYTTGYLTVPVVGAGTANTEFEVLSGMSLKYFGTGEYPYKTILKDTDCESVASDLTKIGYSTHAVHNNGGNFYSRVNAFTQMGFNSFTSKELMNIQSYTPNGSWATDDILVNETIKTLDSTPNQPDFTYTITVSSHGDYPREPVIANPEFKVSGVSDEAKANQYTYYVNQLHQVDNFIADLTSALSKRNEKTIVVMFGDHLPTMGLQNSDMKSGDIYKTKYITWNNFGLTKQDADLKAYQLLSDTTNKLGIHEGTILNYHQTQMNSDNYENGLENLQYDLLYGKRFSYKGKDLYPAANLVMGIDDVTVKNAKQSIDGSQIIIEGSNFTKWSRVYVNGSKVDTDFSSDKLLTISSKDIKPGDKIVVNQLGSSNTIFRSSNEYKYSGK